MIELFGARFRDRSPHPADRRYVYRPPMSPIPAQAAAAIGGRSFDLTARFTNEPTDEGVLFALGSENSGISVFLQDRRLVIDYNAFDHHTIVESSIAVPAGGTAVTARLRRGDGRAGSIELVVDGQPAGRAEVPLYMRMISSVGASVGYDHGSAVSTHYRSPNPFTGVLHEVVVQLVSRAAPGTDEAESRAELARQ